MSGAGRDARRFGAALGAAAVVIAVGVALVGVALSTGGAEAGEDAAATATAAEPTGEPSSALVETPAASIAPTTTGLVLLTDPAWVLEVSEASGIPSRALSAYAGADLAVREESGCAVGWNTLAAIGLVETEHGTIHGGSIDPDGVARPAIVGIPLDGTTTDAVPDTDGGSFDGDTEWDRAVGPLQFIPQSWAEWGSDGDEDGVADVHSIDDAALTAARYLCDARGTLGGQDAWIAAIRSYNADPGYQARVADAAAYYATFSAAG